MELTGNLQIVCPIRGQLKVNKRSKDGLTATEEFYRVEAIKFLISKGYPKENFWIEPIIKKFGNSGRNSFRSDFAVLDVPASTISTNEPDDILGHAVIICEVKRDNKKNEYVKNTQVKPMLDFAKKQSTLGLYWDNIEKRVFWIEVTDGIKEIKEGPLTFVPKFGLPIKTTPLTFNTIEPADSLTETFERIEDILHQASFAPEKRYEIILQLLLTKIFDEHAFEVRGDEPLEIQDYRSLGTSADTTKKKVGDVVKRAISFYGEHLPNKLSDTLPLSGDTLFEILKILAPVKIIHSKRDVVQTFYMKFAKALYKWDMAQYFTPTTVTDFLVDIINPQFGEHIADPACGSADFLVAAFRAARKFNPGFADCIWGVDNSPNAVQVAVLNIYDDPDLTIDPKRYSKKVVDLRSKLKTQPYVLLGDVVDFIPEKQNACGKKITVQKSSIYQYVEIQDIGFGDFHCKEMRGWELPSRAKHFSSAGDIYIGAIWGSAIKWCYIPEGIDNVVVTNGCFRCRVKAGMEKFTPDLLAYLNSEGWGVQMRAFSRGSDGLAEICEDDAKNVIIPLLSDDVRDGLSEYVENLQRGTTTINSVVKQLIKDERIAYNDPDKRPSHIVIV